MKNVSFISWKKHNGLIGQPNTHSDVLNIDLNVWIMKSFEEMLTGLTIKKEKSYFREVARDVWKKMKPAKIFPLLEDSS